jgi:tol-pal system protein YbgF
MKYYLKVLLGLLVATNTLATTVIPAPEVTHFKTIQGGAPVASGKAQTVNNLPPVVDANKPGYELPSHAKTTVTESTSSNPNSAPVVDTSGVTPDARVALIQRQVQSLAAQDYSDKIASIQVQLEKLSGQLAEEENDLGLLQKKQNQFYQALDQRISKLEQLSGKSSNIATLPAVPDTSVNNAPSKLANDATDANANAAVSDTEAYKKAFLMIKAQNYNGAQKAFQNYLKNYPKGQFQWDAHYWSGEIYFSKENFTQAKKQFEAVINNGSDVKRIPVSMLRLARIAMSNGSYDQAKNYLNKLIQNYQGTKEAGLAAVYLKDIKLSSST